MDIFSITFTPLSPCIISKKPPKFSPSLSLSPDSAPPPLHSASIRRPPTPKPLSTTTTTTTTTTTSTTTTTTPLPNPKISKNPLKNHKTTSNSNPPSPHSQNPLSNKLWLSSKLSPPKQPPTSPLITNLPLPDDVDAEPPPPPPPPPLPQFRQDGKIFVGNLPRFVKKNEIAEFFRQFGPIKNVILIRDHKDAARNDGFCFVFYGGPTAASAAAKAVEIDGVDFQGRALTVRLDDGKYVRKRKQERADWVGDGDGREFRSKWHEEREVSRKEFRKIIETQPDNWQAVVSAFERVNKVDKLSLI